MKMTRYWLSFAIGCGALAGSSTLSHAAGPASLGPFPVGIHVDHFEFMEAGWSPCLFGTSRDHNEWFRLDEEYNCIVLVPPNDFRYIGNVQNVGECQPERMRAQGISEEDIADACNDECTAWCRDYRADEIIE